MTSSEPRQKLPYFVRGDLDGFFGLLLDNLVNMMLIVSLCTGLLGMPPSLVFGRILPGGRYPSFWATSFTPGRHGVWPSATGGMM